MPNITQNPFGAVAAPRPRFESARVDVAQAGALGRVAAGIGRQLRDVAVLFRRESVQSETAGLEVRALKNLAAFRDGLAADPDFATHEQRYADFAKDKAAEYHADASDQAWSRFQARFSEIAARGEIAVRGGASGRST